MRKLPNSIPALPHRFLSLDHTSLFAFSKTFRLSVGTIVPTEEVLSMPYTEAVVQTREPAHTTESNQQE
jgi:hypothetical protein